MGNVFESFASGVGKAIGSIFHNPVDFLSGKSCSSLCGPTWDLTCYIENFCIANLLKLGLVLVVVYIVFLFIYLTYKLRVFHCLLCCVFKTIWTCCSTCLCTCCHCCHCLFHELTSVKRRPRRAHMVYQESLNSFQFGNNNNMSLQGRDRARRRYGRRHYIRRSLRPMSHRVRIGFRTKNEIGGGNNRFLKRRRGSTGGDVGHGVRVTRTTKFANKGFASTSRRIK